jgi:sugar lactone lactonase YvrE
MPLWIACMETARTRVLSQDAKAEAVAKEHAVDFGNRSGLMRKMLTKSLQGVLAIRLRQALGLFVFGAALSANVAHAQTLAQIPYVSTAAGIPSGSTQTLCANGATDIKNSSAKLLGDNCLATQATLDGPTTVVLDSSGDLFIADNGNNGVNGDNELRVVYGGGPAVFTEVTNMYKVGNTSPLPTILPGYIYDSCGGGSVTGAGATGNPCYTFGNTDNFQPTGLAIDAGGNVFTSEGHFQRLRVVVHSVTPALTALLNATVGGPYPTAATVKPVVGDEYTITNGVGSIIAYYGNGINAFQALTAVPRGIAVDANENIYFADSSSNSVRMINGTTGTITTIVGSGCVDDPNIVLATGNVPASTSKAGGGCTAGSTGDGGLPTSATINQPYDVALDANGNLYIAEYTGARVRVVYNGGITIPGVPNPVKGYIYTVAGGGTLTAGPATQLKFGSAAGLGIDTQGNLYIADAVNSKIWEINTNTQTGAVIAGGGPASTTGSACPGTFATGLTATDSIGGGCLANNIVLNKPQGHIAIDAQGNLYVADSGNNVVRKLSIAAPVSTTAVGSTSHTPLGFVSMAAQTISSTSFKVQGVATSDYSAVSGATCSGTLAAGADCNLNVSFTPTVPGARQGSVQLLNVSGAALGQAFLAGTATGSELSVDPGTPLAFGSAIAPSGVAASTAGPIYVADSTSGSLFEYASPSANPTTLFTGLSSPGQVAVDGLGNVLVADTGNSRIVSYSPVTKQETVLAGSYSSPKGITVDSYGDIFVADTGNSRVVEITPAGGANVIANSVTAPTQLAVDSSDNLYVVNSGSDPLIKIAPAVSPGIAGTQSTVTTTGLIPTSIAVDAAENVYVLDATHGELAIVSSASSGVVTSLPYTFTTPVSIALDDLANLYIADTGGGEVDLYSREQGLVSYGLVDVGTTNPVSPIVLTNSGTSAIDFSGTPIDSFTGSSVFTIAAGSGSNGCNLSASILAAGNSCTLSSTFAPTTTTSYTAQLSFPSNATANGAATVSLIGSGIVLAQTTTTITLVSPTSNPSPYTGTTPVTISIAVSPVTGSGTPTGAFAVSLNGGTPTSVPINKGIATYSFAQVAGQDTITAVYSSDSQYATSTGSVSLTITPAATATTLTVTPNLTATPPTVTFTAQVSSAVSGFTGSVNFLSGTASLGSVAINAQGVAVLTLIGQGVPSSTLSAEFVPDNSNFASSTSATVTESNDFIFTATPTTITVAQAAPGVTSLMVTPYFGTASVTLSCSGLPANSVCQFSPTSPLTLTGAAQAVTMTVTTNSAKTSNAAADKDPLKRRVPMGIALAALVGCFLFRRRSSLRTIALAIVCLVAFGYTMGCSGSGSTSVTPTGTYPFTVTAKSSGGTTHSVSMSLTITVDP